MDLPVNWRVPLRVPGQKTERCQATGHLRGIGHGSYLRFQALLADGICSHPDRIGTQGIPMAQGWCAHMK